MLAPKMFTEKQCSRVLTNLFGPEIANYPEYQYQITVIYTDEKDVTWAGFPSSKESKGIITGAFLIPKSHIAAGSTLIDLKACFTSVSSSKASIRVGIGSQLSSISKHRASLNDIRYQVISPWHTRYII